MSRHSQTGSQGLGPDADLVKSEAVKLGGAYNDVVSRATALYIGK